MIVADAYSAAVAGVPLSLREDAGGRVTFDSTTAPHVTAELTIARPSAAILAALDPRVGPRVTVVASNGIPRTFDLGVRDRRAGLDPATVVLFLASDEAILTDYAPLSDDSGAFAYQASLRSVINYALNKAIPGASLQAAPATDVNVTTYADASNLATNARCRDNTTGWASSGALTRTATDPTYGTGANIIWGSATTNAIVDTSARVIPGRSYLVSLAARTSATFSGAALVVIPRAADGSALGPVWSSTFTATGSYGTRPSYRFTAPAGTATVTIRFQIPSVPANTSAVVSGALCREAPLDPADIGYFDGDSPDTATYQYDYTGTAGASESTRTALVSRPPDSLLWRAGKTALEFLQPLVQAQGLRLVCDEQRRWTLRNETYTAPGALSLREGVNITEATDTISRDGGYWFDARVTRYTWTDRNGIQQERVDAYALTTPYTRLSTLEVNAPYPGPGRSQYAVRRAQGLGREVTATAPADWTANADQTISVTLPDAPIQIGLTQSVTFDIGTGRMTVTTRTTDTPAGSINLLTGTINALTGTINAL